MRILVIADGRSPISRNWIGDMIESGHDVVLVSSFPHQSIPGLKGEYTLPICFSHFAGSQTQTNHIKAGTPARTTLVKKVIQKYRGVFQQLRYWLGPLTFPRYRQSLKKILEHHVFDLVHILRIPFEGLFAVPVLQDQKFIISIWGNDLTLHAPKNAYMRRNTRKVLERADGLIVDVHRDTLLAQQWGYSPEKPVMVALTSGGIDIEKMMGIIQEKPVEPLSLPQGKFVINPRGIRPDYIRNDTFFAAIPKVLEAYEDSVYFLCPSMLGQPEAEQWVKQYKIAESVKLLPFLSQEKLWRLFSRAQVMVSPSTHDGTPNSLLESMALGAVPVVGDIASLREWVVDGKNGCLVDPGSPDELAAAIIFLLQNDQITEKMSTFNRQLVVERASRKKISQQRDEFYNQILNQPIT